MSSPLGKWHHAFLTMESRLPSASFNGEKIRSKEMRSEVGENRRQPYCLCKLMGYEALDWINPIKERSLREDVPDLVQKFEKVPLKGDRGRR